MAPNIARRSTLPGLTLLALISLLGMAILFYATRWGIGVSPDSVKYITAARNLLAGHGLSTTGPDGHFSPLVHWPPLFPAVLAGIGLLGIDPAHGARGLNILLFGINLLIVGVMIWRYTGRWGWGAAAAVLTALGPPLLFIHAQAWSEPLFLVFTLGGLALLAEFLENTRLGVLAASALLIATAMLARYAGIALIPTSLAGILLLSRRSFWIRVRDCVIFGLIACLPMAAWAMRNHSVAEESTDRNFAYHWMTDEQLKGGLQTLRNWVLPEQPSHIYPLSVSAVTAGILLLALLVAPPLLMWRFRKTRSDAGPEAPADGLSRLPQLLWVFALLYLGTVLLSQTFFDAGIPLDDRMLSPLYAAGLLLLICLAHLWTRRKRTPALLAIAGIAIAFFAINVFHDSYQLRRWHHYGLGLMRRAWVQSETLAALAELNLPANAVIYSNAADAVEFRAGRLAFLLPSKSDEGMRRSNPRYKKNLAEMGKRLRRSNGVIVLFAENLTNRTYLPSADELKAVLPLQLVIATKDGAIYKVANAPASQPTSLPTSQP